MVDRAQAIGYSSAMFEICSCRNAKCSPAALPRDVFAWSAILCRITAIDRHKSRLILFAACITLALGPLGCQTAPIITTVAISPATSHRYVVHLPGMAGWIQPDTNLVQGLGDGGWPTTSKFTTGPVRTG